MTDLEKGEDVGRGDLVTSIANAPEAFANDISFRAVDPVDVVVDRLSLDIDVTPSGLSTFVTAFILKKASSGDHKAILKNVDAYMPSGSLTAIIGSSGSGKTSVLNSLSHRVSGSRLRSTGSITYNGDSKLSNIRRAYVMQQDVLLPTLTVRETLMYATELRLPPPATTRERKMVVEEVILELGLKSCADTRIGNNVHKGCSGGEKRRTSLAVQMLANPSVLFLDEVTTGLDASTAFQLVTTLKALAVKGRTVICTIHQPRSEIWNLFDHVLLLAGGAPLYSGPTSRCLQYFENNNYVIPPFVNPAEFLIDLAAVDTRTAEAEEASSTRVQGLIRTFEDSTQRQWLRTSAEKTFNDARTPNENSSRLQHHAPFGHQVRILTERTLKVTFRDPLGLAGSMLEATTMAVLIGWIFLQLDGTLSGVRSREGAIYTAASLQGYLILLFETYRLTIDIQLFDREYGEGVISVPSFLISRRLARLFVEDVSVPLIFSVIFYFMAGFRPLANQFFVFLGVTLLTQAIAVNYATLCVAISRNFAAASFVANMGFTLQSLGCGYFVQANQIPIWVRWLKVSQNSSKISTIPH